MLNVFDLHFSTLAEKAVSRICASKTERENCKYWAGACNSNSHARGLHYLTFRLQNKAEKIHAMGRVVLRKMFQKSSALSIYFEMRRSPLQIEFATFAPKNRNLFVKLGSKRELEKQELCGHRLIMHSITQRGGECEKRVGGGGRLYTVYTWTRWNVSDMTICEIHKLSDCIAPVVWSFFIDYCTAIRDT